MIRRTIVKQASICLLVFLFCIGLYINFTTPPRVANAPTTEIRFDTSPGNSDPTQDEWPMFHGQLNHTGIAYTTTTYRNSAFWIYSPGVYVYSPAVVGGRVFIGTAIGLGCLDAMTGTFLWECSPSNYVRGCPALTDGRVYMGCDDDHTYCLNATTGAPSGTTPRGMCIRPQRWHMGVCM